MKLEFGYFTNHNDGIDLAVRDEDRIASFYMGNPKESIETWKALADLCTDAINELQNKMK